MAAIFRPNIKVDDWDMIARRVRHMKKSLPKEKFIERQILQWLNYHNNLFAFKYPTTGRYDIKSGKWLKTVGTITGVSDIICIGKTSNNMPFTAFLEVKTSDGKQSLNQKEFQERIKKFNGFYFVVRCIEDVNSALISIEDSFKKALGQ